MSQTSCDLIIHAKWILPIVPANTLFSDCSLVVKNETILDILPTDEAKRTYVADANFELNDHLIMPGLINAHGHAAMSLLRGFADDLPLHTWLNDHIWPAEGKHVSNQFVKDGTELAIAEMIRSGTTCYSDMYFFPEESAEVAVNSGMRCHIAFPVLGFPTPWASTVDEYFSKGLALRDHYRSHSLVTVDFGPHAPYTVDDEAFKRIATLAPELQAGIQVHLHETASEVEQAVEATGVRPLQRLNDLNVLTPLTQCVHMTALNEDDITILQETGAHVIHCPESNLKLASGFCPVGKLMDAGVNVALGTDGCASNNNLDMFGEMHTAALLAKAVSGDAGTLNAHEALQMATINGAKALGIDEITGSLEKGKAADVIAIKFDALDQSPLYNPASHLVYTANGHRVSHTWVAGKALMAERELTTLNEESILKSSQTWQQKIETKND